MIKYFKAITFVFLLTFSLGLLSAQSNYEDVVYLKNGSVIHGIIIEQIPNKSIKIKSGSNIFVYNITEVEKMTKEEISSSNNQESNSVSKYDENGLKEYLITKLKNESSGNLKFIDFQKTNGSSKMINGQDYYEIWFTFSFQPTKTVYKAGNSQLNAFMSGGLWSTFKVDLQKVGGYDAVLISNADQKPYQINQIITLSGKAELRKTEQTWLIQSLSFNKEVLSADAAGIARSLNISSSIKEGDSYFLLRDVPITGSSYFMFPAVKSSASGAIADLAKSVVYKSLSGFKRGKTITVDDFNNETSLEKWMISMDITKTSNTHKSGKMLITNTAYSGYECEIEMEWKMTKQSDPSESFAGKITVKTGIPSDNKTEQKALESAIRKFEDDVEDLLLSCSTFQAKVIGISELDKKGNPKEILLENAGHLSYGKTIYFIITKESSLYITSRNTISMTPIIATAVYKTTSEGNIVCKILSGEQNLTRELSYGGKLIAVSTVSRPAKVD